ncbi:MAG TPA: pseudouridine synthase [Cyclobacteriaceae bacterium]|nr:pseudouridine synthase [Cyclobacteriaceae bacterium]HMV07782.1 pseudouridine synthase [Cyclobacteriaceae bacterium]HMV88050.1 pseudouridine synthase [Cyclobacteriaceae bacterium]HMW98917.1 pseudouridine synthase [Cyclobacteriaceae bacterium]HMX48450.1 pseudouridine synthase [Cyclobacteriaceae bacterium]
MPRRDQSNERNSDRRKSSGGRSRSNSSRSDSPRGERGNRGDSKRPFKSSRGDSKDFSKPRRSYDRKDQSDKPGGNFRKRSEGFSRDNRDDVKKPSRFGKPSGEGNFKRRSEGGSFSRDNRDDSKRPSRFNKSSEEGNFKKRSEGFKRRDEKFSRPRDDRDDSKRSKFSDKEERGEKKGFFSKLTRGGKAFTRNAAPAPEYGKAIEKSKEDLGSDKIRLNRYISNSGVCSRREADELIKMGLVTVNGTVVTEMGHKVSRKDVVKYDGKTLRAEKPVYILMNKPKGFLTTTKDPQDRNTVMQIIAESVKERVYPVGRLDRNTTGLLLLTNDGELADKLMHPSHNVKKIYKVDLDKPLTKADFEKIKKGVHLEEGKAIVDDLAMVSPDNKTIGIEIHIGWNRVIRRIFESLGYEVVKLDRSVYAGLDKKDLSRGHWRHLTREEVVRLKHYQ